MTFQGNYNATATVSYDGKKIAVAQGSGNNYRIAMMDSSLGSPRWSTLSPGSLDESPSFAPNASMVIYAAREGRRGVLYAVSADAPRAPAPGAGRRRRARAGLVAVPHAPLTPAATLISRHPSPFPPRQAEVTP